MKQLKKQATKYTALIKELQILKTELLTGNTIVPVQRGRVTDINIEGINDVINLLEYYNQFIENMGG